MLYELSGWGFVQLGQGDLLKAEFSGRIEARDERMAEWLVEHEFRIFQYQVSSASYADVETISLLPVGSEERV